MSNLTFPRLHDYLTSWTKEGLRLYCRCETNRGTTAVMINQFRGRYVSLARDMTQSAFHGKLQIIAGNINRRVCFNPQILQEMNACESQQDSLVMLIVVNNCAF